MNHAYSDMFYDYIEQGSLRSAQIVINFLMPLLKPSSVIDVGCGRGSWLSIWHAAGVPCVHGIDGAYVNREQLLISDEEFSPMDLSLDFDLGRKFDLVASLEVAEHLPQDSAETFVRSLVRHGEVILFSAATPGQGGEHHVNEQPLAYWQRHFSKHGYMAFDVIRPFVRSNKLVEPWYRFNSILYVHRSRIDSLPTQIKDFSVALGDLHETGDLLWRLRCFCLRAIPVSVVKWIAQKNAEKKAIRIRKNISN